MISTSSESSGLVSLAAVFSAPKTPYIYEVQLSIVERATLSFAVIMLLFLALVGNVGTFIVAVRSRRVRPLFRTCLISLAISDIISAAVTSLNFLTVYFSSHPQLWSLGPHFCKILPFAKVLGDLVNCATLVAIALDRYLSIKNILRKLWEPGGISCLLLALTVWVASAGIAFPAYMSYEYYPVYIVRDEWDDKNGSHTVELIPGYMCGAPKIAHARYYLILFCILFIPMIIAFVLFNSYIAIHIWERRQTISGKRSRSLNYNEPIPIGTATKEGSTALQTIFKGGSLKKTTPGASSESKQTRSSREKRQMRMFCTVVLLMVSYLLLKLPEWIFLIVTFYNFETSQAPRLLAYIFGIISMTSSVMNPLLYAFVTQTIEYLRDLYCSVRDFCCLHCYRGAEALSSVIIPPEAGSGSHNAGDT